jgi:hypothetical protein
MQGFLSLAQANFKAPSGVRYGQDMYDERMKTVLRVYVHDSYYTIEECSDYASWGNETDYSKAMCLGIIQLSRSLKSQSQSHQLR